MDAMPEVKEMMKMKGQMESAVKDYDSSVPRMKAKLPAMKEVRDKKAKKDKFVAQNKARREKKERDAKAAQKKARAPRPPVPYAIAATRRIRAGRGQEARRREGAKREEGDPGEGRRGEEKDRGQRRELVAAHGAVLITHC